MKTLVRSPGSTKRRTVNLSTVRIPDLWHLAMWLEDQPGMKNAAKEVLECWHLAHDLLTALQEAK